MTTAEIIKGSKVSNFVSYRNGVFLYKTDNDYLFEIPASDVAGATLEAQDKTIFFMRWIRKQVELKFQESLTLKDGEITRKDGTVVGLQG